MLLHTGHSPKSAHIDPQGDIVFCDALEGVVAIPKDLLDDVIDLMPKLVHADEMVKEDVQAGFSVFEAFKKHRS
jgi:regulator of RNase E activity RraA